jgi:glycerol-3-phosphate acyltransferase PlsY
MHPAWLLIPVAYLVGSVPFGLLIARWRGVDIRTKGSGNIGATNVWRVMGWRPGLACFVLDFLKGLLPSLACAWVLASAWGEGLGARGGTLLALGVAVGAVLGHVFPVWLKFKGGKGIATSFGALLGVYPVFTLASLLALVVWLISARLTRMVGISSCLAAAALAGWVVLTHLAPAGVDERLSAALGGLYRRADAWQAGFAGVLAALVIFKHRANLARTWAGTESKIGGRR